MASKSVGFARSLRFQITAASVFILILSLGVFFVSSRNLTRQTEDLYRQRTNEQKSIFIKLFNNSGELNKTLATDYSYWDDMVSFIKTQNPTFANENIVPALKSFQADDVWIYSSKTNLVYSTSTESKAAPELNIPSQDLKGLFGKNYLTQFFTKLNGTLYEINAATIVPTMDQYHEGPISGYLIVGREINDQMLTKLDKDSFSQVKLIGTDNSNKYPTDLKLGSGKLTFKIGLNDYNHKPVDQVYVTYDSSSIKLVNSVVRSWLLIGLAFYSSIIIIFFVLSIFKIVRPLGVVIQALQSKNVGTMTRMSHKGNEFGQIAEALKHFFFQQNYMSQELESRAKLEQRAKQHAQDLEKLNNMMVGRELRMIELKKEIAQLKEEKASRLSAVDIDNPEGQGQ